MQSYKWKQQLKEYTLEELECLEGQLVFPIHPMWVIEAVSDELHERYKNNKEV